MSESHQKYIKTYKCNAYINRRPSSSKDAILNQQPLSRAILENRRDVKFTKAMVETYDRTNKMNYDANQIILRDSRQLEISKIMSMTSFIDNFSP